MMQRGCTLRPDWLAARLATRGRKVRPKQRQAKQSRHDPPDEAPCDNDTTTRCTQTHAAAISFTFTALSSSSSPCVGQFLSAFLACTLITLHSDPVAPLVLGRCGHLEPELRSHNKSSRPPRPSRSAARPFTTHDPGMRHASY
jgi:hypothetical protein